MLPSLFGPGVAALVADAFGWRWVFLGIVALVVLAAALLAPVVPDPARADTRTGEPASRSRLAWAVVAAVAVLGVELLGSGGVPLAAVPAARWRWSRCGRSRRAGPCRRAAGCRR